jgi:hypothetical protein
MDQIAHHPSENKIYVPQFSSINVYDTTNGNLLTQIVDSSISWAMGICFPSSGNGNPLETEVLKKKITQGNLVADVDDNTPLEYEWTIEYNKPENGPENVHIIDHPITQWDVTDVADHHYTPYLGCGVSDTVNAEGTVEVYRGGKPDKNCQSATHFIWDVSGLSSATVSVGVQSRRSASGKYLPNACGAFYLNHGVKAIDLDNPGEPFARSNKLCIAAVKDLNGLGLVLDGTGDEDGDSLTDYEEACLNPVKTNPCKDDSDGDGVLDGADNCPGEYNPNQEDEDNNNVGDACEE